MRLTRWSHSCIALEHAGRTLVLDPGVWSEPESLLGADAVLVTHAHSDHLAVEPVRASGVPVWAPRGAELGDLPFTALDPGEHTVAGFEVRAVASPHAPVVPGQELPPHLGYVVRAGGESVHHPGDGLTPPDEPVDVLLVAMQASWLKTAEAIDLIGTVAPRRAVGVHDGQLHDRGRRALNHWLATAGAPYVWLEPGRTLDPMRLS